MLDFEYAKALAEVVLDTTCSKKEREVRLECLTQIFGRANAYLKKGFLPDVVEAFFVRKMEGLPLVSTKQDMQDFLKVSTPHYFGGKFTVSNIPYYSEEEELLLWSETSLRGPLINGIWIKVTNRCNLRCSYCYADSGEGEANELTIEEIENLLIELKPKNYNKIVITGGDPLMRKDIVEILKTCKKYGKVQILTNGTIGNAELYREIMEIVDAIQISLDSYEEIHHDKNRGKGSFVRAVNTVKTLTHINNKKVIVKRYRRWLYGFDDFNRCRSYSFCRNSKEKSLWEK